MNEAHWDRLIQRHLDGALAPEERAEFEALLRRSEAARRRFWELAEVHGLLPSAANLAWGDAGNTNGSTDGPGGATTVAASPHLEAARQPAVWRRVVRHGGWIIAALAVTALLLVWFQPAEKPVVRRPGEGQLPRSQVRFASLAHARFFGELSPPARSAPQPRHEYVLMSGLVELAFPRGASAIVEGPAVFRVLSDECLALDVGRCSVHAPDGAEGFRVETPVTRVVDRGTRFTVNVSEASETKVQVIEGIADVYRHPGHEPSDQGSKNGESAFERRLTERQAHRFLQGHNFADEPAEFDPAVYRTRLPDRVVSFEATRADDGRSEFLWSVTVQRDGRATRYPVGNLVPAELFWFKSQDEQDINGHLVGGPLLARSRESFLSDAALYTGVINPGGSRRSLSSDPVTQPDDADGRPGTPGMAVRFGHPVTNGPGPDVVFFELQTVTNPPDGDAFHVSPLKFGAGRKSHTVRAYDLTLTSPEALPLTGFYLYQFSGPVRSLGELRAADCEGRDVRLKFQVLAVGIDLSDLGYAPGDTVDGLFFQDAEDDDDRVDPVFIGGLP